MADSDAFGTRRRGLEEDYFRRREQELVEKIRLRAEEQAGRRRLAETTGVTNEDILTDLQALGYTAETVRLLHLLPLVQIAWAEGDVSDRERGLIVEAARSHGVEPGSEADRQLADWLSTRPSEDFFGRTLRIIPAILEAGPSEEREARHRSLLDYCSAIASASGGLLGFGKVSDEERRLLSRISEELQRSHSAAAERVVPSENADGS